MFLYSRFTCTTSTLLMFAVSSVFFAQMLKVVVVAICIAASGAMLANDISVGQLLLAVAATAIGLHSVAESVVGSVVSAVIDFVMCVMTSERALLWCGFVVLFSASILESGFGRPLKENWTTWMAAAIVVLQFLLPAHPIIACTLTMFCFVCAFACYSTE
jgi:hypothetical protein